MNAESGAAAPHTAQRRRRRNQAAPRRATLPIILLALATVISAVSSLMVALPSIAADTGASQTELTWIVDAYSLTFAALLLPGGALGDRIGRRLVLLAGMGVFAIGSIVPVFTASPVALIAVRAVLGMAAAVVMPATLSTITASFPPERRLRAVATWAGVAGAGAVFGLFASGLVLEWFSWRAVFVTSAVLAAVTIIGTLAVVPESAAPEDASNDPGGVVLSILGLGAVVYSIIEAPTYGWASVRTVVGITLGLLVIAAFLVWESRMTRPLIDPRYFRIRSLWTGAGVALLWLSRADGHTAYWQLGVGLWLVGIGSGIAMPPATSAITSALPRAQQGVASAINDLARELGGAIGIAVLASVLASTYRHGLNLTMVPEQFRGLVESSGPAAMHAPVRAIADMATTSYTRHSAGDPGRRDRALGSGCGSHRPRPRTRYCRFVTWDLHAANLSIRPLTDGDEPKEFLPLLNADPAYVDASTLRTGKHEFDLADAEMFVWQSHVMQDSMLLLARDSAARLTEALTLLVPHPRERQPWIGIVLNEPRRADARDDVLDAVERHLAESGWTAVFTSPISDQLDIIAWWTKRGYVEVEKRSDNNNRQVQVLRKTLIV